MIRNRPTRFEFVRFAAIVAAGMLFGGQRPASAQSAGRRHGNFMGTSMARMTRTLSLTDEQAKQIKAIYDGHQADRAARSQAVKSAREALQKATVATPLNEPAIKSAAQGVGQAEGDSALLEAKIRAQVAALLNPDQQQKFATYRDSGFGPGRFHFRGND